MSCGKSTRISRINKTNSRAGAVILGNNLISFFISIEKKIARIRAGIRDKEMNKNLNCSNRVKTTASTNKTDTNMLAERKKIVNHFVKESFILTLIVKVFAVNR